MRWFSQATFYLRSLFQRRQLGRQLDAEIQTHVDLATEDYIAKGMKPEDARHAALREFGNVASVQERARDELGWVWLEAFGRDVSFAFRRLWRTPTFTVTALLTLALCIGANTTIFAVVDALVVRPLPFPEPERLMTVINSYPGNGVTHGGPSIPNYFERGEAIKAFAQVAMLNPIGATVGDPGNLRRVDAARVTPEFFAVLGIPLAMGRMFTDAELTYQTAGVVVLTDEFWRTQFGADPNIVGQKFISDGLPSTIIGVLPPNFRFLSSRAQFFKPFAFNPPERALANRHNSLAGTVMIARLGAGATVTEAQAQLDALDTRQLAVDPKAALLKDWRYRSLVQPLHTDYIREVRPILLLLQGGVLVLLLIGAVNLTNLLLVRISGRGKELAVRQALGARHSHLAREIWLETTLLALGGGVVGIALGAAGVRLLVTLGANQLPLGARIVFDGRIATVVLAGALVLGGLLAIAPVWFVRRLSISLQLQSETAGSLSGVAQRLRHSFGAMQIGLAFVLLCGAGLLSVSLHQALAQAVGFRPEQVLVGGITLPWKGYRSGSQQVHFVQRLEQLPATLPEGMRFAVSDGLPFSGMRRVPADAELYATNAPVTARMHYYTAVSPDYWGAMGIPLLRGQLLGPEQYAPNSPRVCVVDRALADTYWPGADPLGKRLSLGASFRPEEALTVIGVVGNVKQAELTETEPQGTIYVHYGQFPTNWMRVVVRGQLPPVALADLLRKKVQEIDPEIVVTGITTMEQLIDDSLLLRRSPTVLAGIFAGIALLLSTVGTYGVLAYAVSHRRREIGVRMALGARPRQVVGLFLNIGGRLLWAGLTLGLFGAWATGRAMRSLLFEVSPFSPVVIGGVTAIMGVVVLGAIVLPAVRAAKVDPCETLRHD